MLLRSVFGKRLRDQRGALIGWGLALLAYVAITVFSYPAYRDLPGLEELLESLPEAVLALVGEADLMSPTGYVNSQLFTLLAPLVLAGYAIVAGAGAIAGEEERGRLDPVLATPIPRWRVAAGSFIAICVVVAALATALGLSIVLLAPLVELEVDPGGVAAASVHVTAFGILFGATALGIGAAIGRRALALGLSAVLALGTYLIHGLGPMVGLLRSIDDFSPFAWFIRSDPLRNGVDLVDLGLLLGVAAVIVLLGIAAFERRDIAV